MLADSSLESFATRITDILEESLAHRGRDTEDVVLEQGLVGAQVPGNQAVEYIGNGAPQPELRRLRNYLLQIRRITGEIRGQKTRG